MTSQPKYTIIQSILWALITTLLITLTWFGTPLIIGLTQPQRKVAQDPTGLIKIDKYSVELTSGFSVNRCNSQRTGFIPADPNIRIDRIEWRKKTMDPFTSKFDDAGTCASCIVTPGLLVTPGIKGTVVGLFPSTGEVKWKTELLDKAGNKYNERLGSLSANQSYIFVSSFEASKQVWLLNRESGKIVWNAQLESGCSAPAVLARDAMIIHGHSGILGGYEKSENRWTFSTGSDTVYPPAIVPKTNHSIFVNGDGRVYRLNLANGRLLWVTTLANDSGSAVAILDNYCYITDRGGFLSAINIKDGTLEWRTEAELVPLDSPATDGKSIVVTGRFDDKCKVIAIDKSSGNVIWKIDLPNMIEYFDPYIIGNQVLTAVCDNKIHLSSKKAELILLNVADGKEQQRFQLHNVPGQTITLTSGNIWINTIQGYTIKLSYK